MSSPIITSLFSRIRLKPGAERPLYLQLSDAILALIRTGQLKSGQQLPSSRALSGLLSINRITISKAFEELQLQGWLEGFVGRGTFVAAHIPEEQAKRPGNPTVASARKVAGFAIDASRYAANPYFIPKAVLHLDDGYPDPRLAPLQEIYRAYRNQLSGSGLYRKFGGYSFPDGPEYYKDALSGYLNETRSLKTTSRNILSVRGTLMGVNLVCNALIRRGDIVVSGIPGWQRAEHNFIHAGAKHLGIPVDDHGLVVTALEQICKRKKVRIVYVTPHHHYPTTVSLRIDRRLELLRLAERYGFIIFEDDYDFDFHYSRRPLPPLASTDENGMVIYCGSFSKSFSPAFRAGYLVAPENVINHLANVRILLDRQGDHILDHALATLLNDGTLQRYARKALKAYEERRDHFCSLLQAELGAKVTFNIPEGGMTVWTRFARRFDPGMISRKAYEKGLYLSDGSMHRYPGYDENAVRLGFASATPEELDRSVAILKTVLNR